MTGMPELETILLERSGRRLNLGEVSRAPASARWRPVM